MVMNIDTKKSEVFKIDKKQTLSSLKEKISSFFGINKQQIVVHTAGTMYHNEADNKTLEDLEINRVIKIHKFIEAALKY